MERTDKRGVYTYSIEQRDTDFNDRSTHVALMNYILQAAGDDADINGFGIKDLNCGNCSWVLSRMCVEFIRVPYRNEALNVRTWVNEVGRMMTTRNMIVTDGDDQVIARAVTQWAVIDITQRVAVDIRANIDYEGYVSDEPSPMTAPARIHKITEPDGIYNKKVSYSDMDFNRHMTAMKYVEWMVDCLPLEVLSDDTIARIDLNFLHESLYGDELSMAVKREEGCYIFEITPGNGLPACRGSFKISGKGS